MKKATHIISFSLLIAATLLVNTLTSSLAWNEIPTQKQFPPGKWSFSAHPYMGEGFESRPIVVTSVRTELKNLSVTAVRIRNISSKPVTAVKLGWYLSNENEKSVVLQQGETPLINIDRSLAVGEEQVIKSPITSFAEIHRLLVQAGHLEGCYRLDVMVTEILFEDQSTWKIGQSVTIQRPNSDPSIVRAMLRKGSLPIVVTPLSLSPACAKQKCDFLPGPPPGYSCGGSDNEEFCTNCGTSCCTTICGFVPECNCN